MKSFHCVVTGKVDEGNFLAWVHDHAVNYALKGWVRHISDGKVEIMAQGPEDRAAAFAKVVRAGSPMSGMTETKTEWMDYETIYEKFEIR